MNDIRSEGAHRCTQRRECAEIRNRRNRPDERWHRNALEFGYRGRLIIEEVPGTPGESDVKDRPIELPGSVQHDPLRAAEFEPGDGQKDPDTLCLALQRPLPRVAEVSRGAHAVEDGVLHRRILPLGPAPGERDSPLA